MSNLRSTLRAFLLTAFPILLASCGGGADSGSTGPPTEDEYLTDLKAMVEKYQADNNGNGPSSMKELQSLEPSYPAGYAAVSHLGYSYNWGSGLNPGSKAVLAASKGSDKSGGRVLLQDGTIVAMSAAEYTTAPKAGKK